MKCWWHCWDIFEDIESTDRLAWWKIRTTKICRKCGEKRIKEKIT